MTCHQSGDLQLAELALPVEAETEQRAEESSECCVSVAELHYLVAVRQIPVLLLGGQTFISLTGVDAYLARHGSDHATPYCKRKES